MSGASNGVDTAVRVLIIDNYDSFTYNLVQMLRELGADVTVWRNDAFEVDDVAREGFDAIVVSPGPGTPDDAGHSVEVVRRYGPDVPTLGVCLGHQAIGVAYGAKVVPAPVIMHGKTSRVRHDGGTVFEGLGEDVDVTRYHSLVIEDLPGTLQPTAWADDDGTETIMAVRHATHPVWGVQFHPESILTDEGRRMLQAFLDAAVAAR